MPTGTSVAHIGGQGHRPLPMATGPYRDAHQPQPPKPTGLDWNALSPTCTGCGQQSMDVHVDRGLCPACDPVGVTSTPTATDPTPKRRGRRSGMRVVSKAEVGARDRRRLSEETRAAIVEAYTAGGATMREIHDALGPTTNTIAKVLRDAGVEIRPPRRRAAPKPAKAPKSPSTQQLLTALGVTPKDVKQWAVSQDLIPAVARGRVSHALVTAYATAHHQQEAS